MAEYVGEIINQKELDLRRKQRRRDRHLFFLHLGAGDVREMIPILFIFRVYSIVCSIHVCVCE